MSTCLKRKTTRGNLVPSLSSVSIQSLPSLQGLSPKELVGLSYPQSIVHLFFEACEKFDKSNAVQMKINGQYKPYSHKFFRQKVTHFGRGLMELGLNPGEKVAIFSETRFEWAVADLGIMGAGGIVVPVYQTLTGEQAAYILNHSGAMGVVCSSQALVDELMTVKDELKQIRFIIRMDAGETSDDVLLMSEVEQKGLAEDNESEFNRRWQEKKPEDMMTIIYTSGTTGHPKGVVLTHGNVLSNINSCMDVMPCTEEDTCLSHLPLSHILERMAGYYLMIHNGVSIAYAEDIKTVAQNLMEIKPTVMISVPRLFEKIYAKVMANASAGSWVKKKIFFWALGVGKKALPYLNNRKPLPSMLQKKYNLADKLVFSKIREKTGGQLKYLVSGGAPLAKEIAEMFLGVGLVMLEGYGLTETSPVLCINRPEKNKPGTVGPPVPDVELKIAADGEILAKGPNVMQGYYENPEATSKAIIDGWFHTGDIGVLDEDGYLRITDRKKDLIVTSGGKNIAPQPLESALKLSPLIEQAVVIGDKHNFISALLAPPWETVEEWAGARGWDTDPIKLSMDPKFHAAVEKEVARQLEDFAHYEKVKKFVILPELLSIEGGELTPSMKVKRKVVNEKYAAQIDSIYA